MKTAVASRQARPSRTDKNGRLSHAGKKIWRSRYLYLLLLPTFVWYIVFMYAPLYGAQIAFRDFMPALGITGGKWVGFKYFIQFFKSEYFVRLMKNTLGISVYSIVVGFPIPVILALLMNEVRSKYFKKGVQTIVYGPHPRGCTSGRRAGQCHAVCRREYQCRPGHGVYGNEHGGRRRWNECPEFVPDGGPATGCRSGSGTAACTGGAGRLDMQLRTGGECRQVLRCLRKPPACAGRRLEMSCLRSGGQRKILPGMRQAKAGRHGWLDVRLRHGEQGQILR